MLLIKIYRNLHLFYRNEDPFGSDRISLFS